ncbi:hypothetical protein [Erwinia aeris]
MVPGFGVTAQVINGRDECGGSALPIYREMNWDYNAKNPGGKSYACKRVG